MTHFSLARSPLHLRRRLGRTLVVLLVASGCRSVGPLTIPADRFNYNQTGAESTKEQLLLNIVRLRYGEPIYFLEINSMLSQYQLDATGHASYSWNSLDTFGPSLRAVYGLNGDRPSWERGVSGTLGYSDRPTITYSPVQGEQFAQQVMAPIPPATIVYLAHSGWSIDRLLGCCVQKINEVRNDPIHDIREDDAAPSSFIRLEQLLQKLQDHGMLNFAIESEGDVQQTYMYAPADSDAIRQAAKELRTLLGYKEVDPKRLRVVTGPARVRPDDLAIETRSLLATMYALAQRIPVPPEHLKAHEIPDQAVGQPDDPIWLSVNHSRLPQLNPFAQVFYNGYWYYVERSDWSSKRTFALLTYLFSLQATAKGQGLPVLTVPAGGR